MGDGWQHPPPAHLLENEAEVAMLGTDITNSGGSVSATIACAQYILPINQLNNLT
jgi:hypothetical protein